MRKTGIGKTRERVGEAKKPTERETKGVKKASEGKGREGWIHKGREGRRGK